MERKINSQLIYEGKIIDLSVDEVKLRSGRITRREVVSHRGSVTVLPIISNKEIILVKQFRYAVKRELFEAPAGTIEKKETPYETAYRELIEETGYLSNNLEHIISFYTSPGYTTELMHLFFARNLQKKIANPEIDEDISIKIVPLDYAIHMIGDGKIVDAKTIIALLLFSK
jgi:ADP-ribose pyrophosphatase